MQLFLVIGLVILCLILQETLSNTSKPGNEIEPLKKKKKDEHIIVVDYNEYTGEYDLEVYDYYRIYSHPEIDLLCFYTYHRCKKKKKKHRLSHGEKVRVPKKQVMCLLNSEGSQCVGQKLTLSKRIGAGTTTTIKPITASAKLNIV